MPDIEPIIDIARDVLVGVSPLGRVDTFLFDHSVRVMRVADRLSRCREVREWRIDRFALSVAALFHQAATVRLDEERRTSTVYAAATMSAQDVKEYSAELASDRLQSLMPARQLELVQEVIRRTTRRRRSRRPGSCRTPTAWTTSGRWACGATCGGTCWKAGPSTTRSGRGSGGNSTATGPRGCRTCSTWRRAAAWPRSGWSRHGRS